MNITEEKRFGAVSAFRLGFGPVGPPWMCVHFYHLDGVVIDSAQHHMQSSALKVLDGRPVSRVLLTHHHEDHSGNAAAISTAFGIPVLGHPVTAEKMQRSFPIKPYQRYVWGRARRVSVGPLPPMVETGRYRLQPVHCPGHSRDHTAYLEPDQGWLFSGDLYLGERIKFFRADEVFSDQITSLKKILAHDFDTLFCAHNPCLQGGKSKLRGKLQFLEDLFGRVQEMKAAGDPTAAVIRRLDRKRDRLIRLVTLGNVSFANMIRSAYG